jgi:hypothetical protein
VVVLPGCNLESIYVIPAISSFFFLLIVLLSFNIIILYLFQYVISLILRFLSATDGEMEGTNKMAGENQNK